VLQRFLHRVLIKFAPLCFNVLNLLLVGNMPPLGGASVILEEDGRFLLVFHMSGLASFPGGLTRWGEHPEQTAVRECREETGLDVELCETIGACSTISTNPFRLSTIKVVYAGTIIGGSLRGSIEGHPRWVIADELDSALEGYCPDILKNYFAYREHLKQP
jgi:ADP-ribose pyrophosphatase YjhB (NUDIX family)